jgi:hypothetical protein
MDPLEFDAIEIQMEPLEFDAMECHPERSFRPRSIHSAQDDTGCEIPLRNSCLIVAAAGRGYTPIGRAILR